jgi:hypothetical protein
MQMPIEHELGTLIRRMNPYTSGGRGSMLFELHARAPFVVPATAATPTLPSPASGGGSPGGTAPTAPANPAQTAARTVDAARAAVNAAREALDAAREALDAAEFGAAARGAAEPNEAVMAFHRARFATDAAIRAAEEAANAVDPLIDLSHIDFVIDDFYNNYSSADWVFRGQPQTVKRALRITYRYPFTDAPKNLPGLCATEHILVGYAGGNGSA